jgi:TonB family protein
VASATSASRSPATAAPAGASVAPVARPASDLTAITTHDDFLLELGQALGGQAAVRPVETLEAALDSITGSKRSQVLVIDARSVRDVRAAVDAVHARVPRVVTVVFAENAAEKQLGERLKGSKVFAVLPTPVDARKTQAVLEGAIAEATANHSAAAGTAAPPAELSIGNFRPQAAADRAAGGGRRTPAILVPVLVAAALAAAAGGGAWWYFAQGRNTAVTRAAPPSGPVAAPVAATQEMPAADTSIVQGKVDELLEKARLAMHERRFTEPAGDNALLYYRSAAAADPGNLEARDGLQRVAGVLAGRFDEALTAGRFDEAAANLANFKAAAPGDGRGAAFEQRFYSAAIARTLADGNLERATTLVHQAQQSGALAPEQIARWRAELARRQEDVKVQHLAGLVADRVRDGRLADGEDSAKAYVQQLQSAAPANSATQHATQELITAELHKAREAALAKNLADQDRWLAEARAVGAKPADIAAFQRELAGARQKAAQAESERLLQLSRERLRDGRLTDPAQDSALFYLTQLQSGDPGYAGLADAGHELAARLLERARAAAGAGKSPDADLALAQRWGASAQDVLAVQRLQSQANSANAAVDTAALAASLKRVRGEPPDYPPNALTRHISGSVTLEYTVDIHGATRDVHVVEATPPGVFDQAAINAARHWRYAPVTVNGAAVEVPVKFRMRFELPK